MQPILILAGHVARRGNLVYSAALRCVGNAQAVFIILARRAGGFVQSATKCCGHGFVRPAPPSGVEQNPRMAALRMVYSPPPIVLSGIGLSFPLTE